MVEGGAGEVPEDEWLSRFSRFGCTGAEVGEWEGGVVVVVG